MPYRQFIMLILLLDAVPAAACDYRSEQVSVRWEHTEGSRCEGEVVAKMTNKSSERLACSVCPMDGEGEVTGCTEVSLDAFATQSGDGAGLRWCARNTIGIKHECQRASTESEACKRLGRPNFK